MKRSGKWVLSLISKAIVIVVAILLLPFAKTLLGGLLPDATCEIRTHSAVIEQKLTSSKRLEVTTVDEEGVLEAKTNVIIFGTVGTTTIRYRYTASLGIDLGKVIMTTDSDRIQFFLPEPEILNDGIEALEVNKQNLFSKAIEKSVETLLSEQRLKCREQYLTEDRYSGKTWDDLVLAFEQTVCQWLEQYGERHYKFEYIRQDEQAAGTPAAFNFFIPYGITGRRFCSP